MVYNGELEYLKLIKEILDNGKRKPNRTGIDTLSLFGKTIQHDFECGFPLFTTKKVFWKGIAIEMLWFLKGTEDVSYLLDNNVHIWDEWMQDIDGKKVLKHTYGCKWRNFYGCDQITRVIKTLQENPDSRRHIVSAWDAPNVDNAALSWCHYAFQFEVDLDEYKSSEERPKDNKQGDISLLVTQRSCDAFLGFQFNLPSYSLLLYMIAEICNYRPKSIIFSLGNVHIYDNHVEQCKIQLSRKPYSLPKLKINHRDSIDDFVYDDFTILDYKHYPAIKADVAV